MSNKKDTLGDRMKRYESVQHAKLMRRTPVVIRIDGKAFHTFTRGLEKPFDSDLNKAMTRTTVSLVTKIQGAVFGYTQSDEISILLQDWATFQTDAWFDGNIQKIVSVAASIATASFNANYKHPASAALALFDARVFNVPFEEVTNYFIWRQQDAVRNSIQGLAQANFSHKTLQGLNVNKIQDLLMLERGINWNDVETRFKRGVCVNFCEGVGVFPDLETPIFTQDRLYIENYLKRDE